MEYLRRLWVLGAIVLAILISYSVTTCAHEQRYNKLLQVVDERAEEITTVRNRTRTLEGALSALKDENSGLVTQIQELGARPQDIKYITRVETVVVARDPVYSTPDLPDHYVHQLDNNIVVAEFKYVDPEYVFTTYDLRFRTDLVISRRRTSARLIMNSSADPNAWYEVPTDVQSIAIAPKLFEPHVGIGISGQLPVPNVLASAFVSLVHPGEDTDLLSIRLSGNRQQLRLGLDPIGYNIGSQVPVLTDLWIYGGTSIGTNLTYSADLTLGTKF